MIFPIDYAVKNSKLLYIDILCDIHIQFVYYEPFIYAKAKNSIKPNVFQYNFKYSI